MPDLRDIIARGRPFTGRVLLQALEIAGKPPIGGRDMIVTARGSSDAVISKTGFPIIRRRQWVHLILLGSAVLRTNAGGFPIEFTYQWAESRIDAGGAWEVKPGGKQSNDPNRLDARNFAEVNNGETEVLYGTPVTGPNYTIDGIFPIPSGQPVTALELPTPSNNFAYWFEAYNRANIVCTP